jgi:hypothetical protein
MIPARNPRRALKRAEARAPAPGIYAASVSDAGGARDGGHLSLFGAFGLDCLNLIPIPNPMSRQFDHEKLEVYPSFSNAALRGG